MEGLIYAAIVAIWGALLVPHWLRRREQQRASRASEPGQRVRLLARRRPTTARHATPPPGAADVPEPAPTLSRDSRRDRCRRAARRRRRVLVLLVVLASGVGAAVAMSLLPWPAALPGALLVVSWLGACRAAARRERARLASRRHHARRLPARRPDGSPAHRSAPAWRRSADAAHRGPAAREPARQVPAVEATAAAAEAAGDLVASVAATSPGEQAALAAAGGRAGGSTLTGGLDAGLSRAETGWQPVPVPLPTYVTAPKARRSIRTIDLTAPGAWTAGLEAARSAATIREPVAPTSAPPADQGVDAGSAAVPGDGFEHRRAVGD